MYRADYKGADNMKQKVKAKIRGTDKTFDNMVKLYEYEKKHNVTAKEIVYVK